MIASALGSVVLMRAKACSTAASSPRMVLPATITGRCGEMRKKRSTRSRGRPCPAAAGSSRESNLRLPVTVTRAGSAPRSTSRRADSSLCMQNRSTSSSTRRKNGRISRYRGYERTEMRPLITTVFTPRFRHIRSRFGQISVSIMMKTRGLHDVERAADDERPVERKIKDRVDVLQAPLCHFLPGHRGRRQKQPETRIAGLEVFGERPRGQGLADRYGMNPDRFLTVDVEGDGQIAQALPEAPDVLLVSDRLIDKVG